MLLDELPDAICRLSLSRLLHQVIDGIIGNAGSLGFVTKYVKSCVFVIFIIGHVMTSVYICSAFAEVIVIIITVNVIGDIIGDIIDDIIGDIIGSSFSDVSVATSQC